MLQDDVSVTESTVLRDMDDFLEEAMDESSDEGEDSTPPKRVGLNLTFIQM